MTEHELAKKLVKENGRCFDFFASCRQCPIGKKDGAVYHCDKSDRERVRWAKRILTECSCLHPPKLILYDGKHGYCAKCNKIWRRR